jgi:hypothetical protein
MTAGSHDELDLQALARGDRVAADVLVEQCRSNPSVVLKPDVFAALRALCKDRARARAWEALLAQLSTVHVDVRGLKRALKGADEVDEQGRGDDPPNHESDTQASRLLAIADQCDYFRDEFGMAYMSVEQSLPAGGSRLETMRLGTRRARLFFVNQYTLAFSKPPSDTALRGVLDALAARATFGDEVHPVFIRRARYNGKIYIDRGTEDGSAYEVDETGWRINIRPPVRFIRMPGMLPLPRRFLSIPGRGCLSLRK